MSKKHYGYSPCMYCKMRLSHNGAAYTSHYRKHVREGVLVEKRDGEGYVYFEPAAQQNAHLTPETQAASQAVINAETLEPSDSVPQSAQSQVA